MRSTLAAFCLVAALASPQAGFGATAANAANPANTVQARVPPRLPENVWAAHSLEKIDGELHRGEWAAAEEESRSLLSDAMLRKTSGTFDAVARLALAEAGLGRTEDAVWHWWVAQNLGVSFDPKPFGAPGELLASHPLRHPDEVPAGLTLRRTGDGGAPFSPPHIVEAKKVEIPGMWGAFPRGIRLQAIVDSQGRVEQPVITQSTSPVLTYAVLKSLRDSRFEPARAGEVPVTAFYEIQVPGERRPLGKAADLTGSPLAEPEATLRAGRYKEAGKQVEKIWESRRKNTIPSRGYLGMAMAMKALAQAGQGEADGAICRWQAAQTLEPLLYTADLSAYGAAGKLLEDHPWGESVGPLKKVPIPGEPSEEIQRPVILTRRQPQYPGYARQYKSQGKIIIESVITSTGLLRNLALLTTDAVPGLEASALDAICDWRFKPAIFEGKPVPVYYSLTVNFEVQ
jgi:TonB family protein